MLELPRLWVSAARDAGRPAGPAVGRVRALHDPLSRALVGHVVVYRRQWWQWRRSRGFAVYEAPDASLVFCGRFLGWLDRTTVVEDADGQPVALVRGDYVLTPFGGVVASHEVAPDGRAGSFLGTEGEAIGSWRNDGFGILVEFGPAVYDEPFVKMGLFAAALTLNTAALNP